MDNLALAKNAVAVVDDVGRYLRNHWGRVEDTNHSVKAHPTDHDVVTVHDVEAERRLLVGLSRIDPSIGFTGEEGGRLKEGSRFWLVDPIDGTDAFIRDLPFCTVQIALIEDGQPVIGVIYDFCRPEMLFAVKGYGAFCNNRKVKVSNRVLSVSQTVLEIDVRTNLDNLGVFQEMSRLSSLYSCHASGWELAQVATGRLEGKVFCQPWAQPLDLAPGALLVQEAGGIVTNIGKNTYDFLNTDVIAANPIVHRQLTQGPDALFPLD